ncbi:chloride channel protein [Phenylobacterium hankyongense]|uniref:Chloride channel protein n=1 Tax=Phenylobacterium hankyongense TaxID=1813876 RepID=A0A328AWC5_9CAUL|nr:chloride channel protein [Phenylobacterium hankyongense]RAK59390.1 chloride channel protein [Phenylobacterium hankyongense]
MIDIPLPARRKPARLLAALRQRLRTSELWLIALSVAVGAAAGLLAVFQSRIAHGLQSLLYGIGPNDHLSASAHIRPLDALWLPVGGLGLGLFTWLVRRRRTAPLVDVVEANALYGGVMSPIDSAVVCAQTVLSNGLGASVGLEAAYAQAGGAAASWTGGRLKLRRHDMRILVGAGAGAAIGAAFGAPLTGAFYAFEIVIGSYTPSAIAPVAAACLASVLAARGVGGVPYSIEIKAQSSPDAIGYLLYAGLGLICALVGVAIMRLVPAVERAVRASKLPLVLRPAVGGLLLAGLALLSPQTLSAGHGALHLDLAVGVPLVILAAVFLLKTTASVVSLGFGFRGGLFFASLFLGTLLGQLYAGATDFIDVGSRLSAENAALVGMGALAVAIVGGPLTMSFLVLETTRDFGVTAATLAAALIASAVVRERFGYSFSTWRLHLRGETIRSARDIGWMRTLTAGRMMRRDPQTLPVNATVAEFRRRFPLGSGSRVILLDDTERYAGLVLTASAYAEGVTPESAVEALAISREVALTPEMNIEAVMRAFEASETEELAVVDEERRVLGLLAEAYVTRRYASELERQHLDLYGEVRA